jgi:hypothetical protein
VIKNSPESPEGGLPEAEAGVTQSAKKGFKSAKKARAEKSDGKKTHKHKTPARAAAAALGWAPLED